MCLTFQVSIDPVAILTAACTAASRPFGDLRDPEPGINDMVEAMDKLRSLRMDLDDKIRLAYLAGLTPTNQIKDWLAQVSAVDDKVSKIKNGRQNCSANWGINRQVRRRMADIAALLERGGAFETVAILPAPRAMQEVPVAEQPDSLSIGSHLSKLRAYLQDDDGGSRIIGIWGMGGVGKTTLLQCLNNELHSSSESGQILPEFEHVIWLVASKDYKLRNLQCDIAERLGLPSHEDNAKQASVIFNFLKDKSFLLLLDDLWQPLDFIEVGIPHPLHAGSSGPKQKVVFTTRLEIVCGKMQARRIMKLECLKEDEAWQLFQNKVGEETLRAHARIPQLARQVAKECDGLPLALVVIGAAMSTKKTPMEWQNAITLLKKSKLHEIPDMEEEKILPKLKFSYDNLDEVRQKCILLCCLWPEDYSIERTKLIECWMGHGLIDERKFDNINEAYDNGHALIGSLLAACLLEPGIDPDREVKMHDVIRDLSVWITSNYGENPNKFITSSSASAFHDAQSDVERISLMGKDVKDTSDLPSNCSKLETLILTNYFFKSIQTEFFKGTPALVYLNLSSTSITELQSEIGLLSSLRYLNLSYTNITHLPLQLGYLRKLRFLILRNMQRRISIPEGLFEKLEMLSVIDIADTSLDNWKEILRLRGSLKGVCTDIKTAGDLQLFIQLSNVPIWHLKLLFLEGFNGPLHLESLTNQSSIHTLYIYSCESLKTVSIDSNNKRGNLLWLEKLELSSLPELREIVFKGAVHAETMPSLTKLSIGGCNKLLNISWVKCLPSLKELSVIGCKSMEQVVDEDRKFGTSQVENVLSGSKSGDAFPSLKKIRLYHLPSLRMFANRQLPFPSLEILEVRKCPEMKILPFGSEIIEQKKLKQIHGKTKWWEKLEIEGDVRAALSPYFSHKPVIDRGEKNKANLMKTKLPSFKVIPCIHLHRSRIYKSFRSKKKLPASTFFSDTSPCSSASLSKPVKPRRHESQLQ